MVKTKLIKALVSVSAVLSLLATPLYAGSFGIGVTGSAAHLSTNGEETLKDTSVVEKASHSTIEAVPSIFVQYGHESGFVVGIDYIPGETSLGAKSTSRQDNLAVGTYGTGTAITQQASAELSDHISLYVETPGLGGESGTEGIYLTAKWNQVDVKTTESLGTGASYGNKTVDGATVGIGWKNTYDNGMLMKFETTYTGYGDMTFSSSGSDAVTTIQAESEVMQARFSLGYTF